MCGIVGFWDNSTQRTSEKSETTLQRMMNDIRHRGPDSDGHFIDHNLGLYFGHKRLSIVDLSPTGHQPMATHSGRMMIVYNGELYNTEELRSELTAQGIRFKGHSDTEVLVEAIEAMGIETVLPRLNGMFAFAVYDRYTDTLSIARDHIGIKPIFWSYQKGIFVFGSELKPFRSHEQLNLTLNKEALAYYLNRNYIAGDQSIYNEVHKLPSGHFLTLKRGNDPIIKSYWMPKYTNDLCLTAQEVEEYLHDLLSQAVKDQMVSDVPIGLFLSGGIDSSLVAALMQTHSSTPIRTFTIGFEEDSHNESHYARRISAHLGTAHTEETLDLQRALDIIPDLPTYYDEPFADSSQLPMLLLSQMSRKHVTVCLSGDGGDELFLGYSRYKTAHKLFRDLPTSPLMASITRSASVMIPWSRLPGAPENMDLKLEKLSNMMKLSDSRSRYREMVSLWPNARVPLKGDYKILNNAVSENDDDLYNLMRAEDLLSYLPDDILQKSDRATMAHGLEARVPLLDKRVMEAALRLPSSHHIQNEQGKIILRRILARYVPEAYFDRPKKGFSVPIASWLRRDLRDLAEEHLSVASLQDTGYLDVDVIRTRWEQHLAGTHNWQQSLWGILMFQLWRQHYKI